MGGSVTSHGGGDTGGGGAGGGGAGGGAGGANIGGPCGAETGDTCAAGEYCDFPDNKCGSTGPGKCTPAPGDCPVDSGPVCACDGTVYLDACEAAASGFDLSTVTPCPSPQSAFPCGSGYCEEEKEYCLIDPSEDPGAPDAGKCIPLPPNCQFNGIACACLADVACGSQCVSASGGLTLTCSGG